MDNLFILGGSMKEKNLKITLDKERTLKYTLNSLIKFEKLTGKSVTEIGENMSMEVILALLYVGLIHEDKKLTIEKLGDMITIDKFFEINDVVTSAFTVLK